MLSRCMARTISIVGAGRVGRTLAHRLHKLGWRIGAIVTRSSATARAAVRAIGAGTPFSISWESSNKDLSGSPLPLSRSKAHVRRRKGSPEEGALAPEAVASVPAADVILFTTPDDALPSVAHSLAQFGGSSWRGKIALHTSGTLDRTVLAPLARFGAHTGSLHPMQAFSGPIIPKLAGVTFAIEGHPKARRAAQKIARQLGGSPVIIASRDKPIYHATAVLTCGSAYPLIESSLQMLRRIGFTRQRAMQTLLPLTRQMLDNVERLGPRAAWTGPLSRGDYAVIAAHAKALRRYPREIREAYAVLARLAARVLAKQPGATAKRLDRALKHLKGGSR
jgi:predicted short-subunit dehydrogenase-like oxidoreductase (DUF2520 family)